MINNAAAELMIDSLVQSGAHKDVYLRMLSLTIRRFRAGTVSDSIQSKIQSKDFYARFSPGFRYFDE